MQFSNLSTVVWTEANNDYLYISSPTRLVAMTLALFIVQLVSVDNNKALKVISKWRGQRLFELDFIGQMHNIM